MWSAGFFFFVILDSRLLFGGCGLFSGGFAYHEGVRDGVGVAHPAEHHFGGGRLAVSPVDGGGWIRGVVGLVVPCSGEFYDGAFGHEFGFFVAVGDLPVEIVSGYVEH